MDRGGAQPQATAASPPVLLYELPRQGTSFTATVARGKQGNGKEKWLRFRHFGAGIAVGNLDSLHLVWGAGPECYDPGWRLQDLTASFRPYLLACTRVSLARLDRVWLFCLQNQKSLDILAERGSSTLFPWVREGTSNVLVLCLVHL